MCWGFDSCSHDTVRGLMEAQEDEVAEEGINYVAMRNLFVREAVEVKVEKKTRTRNVRESADRLELGKTVKKKPILLDLQQKSHFHSEDFEILHCHTTDGGMVRIP